MDEVGGFAEDQTACGLDAGFVVEAGVGFDLLEASGMFQRQPGDTGFGFVAVELKAFAGEFDLLLRQLEVLEFDFLAFLLVEPAAEMIESFRICGRMGEFKCKVRHRIVRGGVELLATAIGQSEIGRFEDVFFRYFAGVAGVEAVKGSVVGGNAEPLRSRLSQSPEGFAVTELANPIVNLRLIVFRQLKEDRIEPCFVHVSVQRYPLGYDNGRHTFQKCLQNLFRIARWTEGSVK